MSAHQPSTDRVYGPSRRPSRAIRAVAALAMFLLIGCETSAPPPISKGQKVTSERGGGDLTQALESLRKIEASSTVLLVASRTGEQGESIHAVAACGAPSRVRIAIALQVYGPNVQWQLGEQPARALYYLNQWLNHGDGITESWEPDRMLEALPRGLHKTPGLDLASLRSFEFTERSSGIKDDQPQDLTYLQQALWLFDVADRVRREPPPVRLAPWLKELEKSTGQIEAERLAAAERLFDWTIRNIQLDPLPPPARGPEALAGEGTAPNVPALAGEVGAGYAHTPYELLNQGHGDAHERSRLFILLCRQAGIDAVMLARFDEKVSTTPQPWLPAVLIGKQLYLFDAELGLPIPGPGGQGIATLAQAVGDPAVLNQLDLPGGPAYAQSPSSLAKIVALVEAEPEALSRRMALLQKEMPSKLRLVLSVQPSALRARLGECQPALHGVRLWNVPFEAIFYQIGRPRALSADPKLAEAFHREEVVFYSVGPPLLLGRNLHLQGQFENSDQIPGARKLYLDSRMSDEQRKLLYVSERFRQAMGFYQPLPEDEKQRTAVLETLIRRTQRIKEHATYWLGLTYYESGKYNAVIEWLDKPVMQAALPSPWRAGARYNLARSYEALGQTDKAVELLEADDSPQRHGNLLRAAWLKGQWKQ